ncbi:MAG: hypothetical protein KatS3mg076_2486 [Candidatus Binatia bacterium]|nr:MAG: hypothetical protein KatS3mg076_2486 [Candidatus Binatia bacterium]
MPGYGVVLLERYVRFVVRHRVGVLVLVGLLTVFFASRLRSVHLEIRRDAQFPKHHEYVRIQDRITEIFGGEAVTVIGVVAREGTIFRPEILAKVHRITEGLLRTPGIIESSVFSLAAPYVKAVVTGPDGVMDVHPLMEEPPETTEEVERLRREVREDPLLADTVVSRDETATIIVADFDEKATDAFIAKRIHEIVEPERDESVTIALAGAPILKQALMEYTRMIGVLFPLAVVVIGLVHYEAFRTLQAMILPLVTALLSVVWALGIVGWSGQPLDTWSAITPVIILAVAAGHAVQILKRYYEEYAIVGDNDEAVVRSVTAVGPVMLTAGFIASAGFASLLGFDVHSVRVFGALMASGILSALVLEMTFTPACRSLLPAPKRREAEREAEKRWLDRFLSCVAGWVVGRPRAVLAAGVGVTLLAGLGLFRLEVDNSFRYWFSPSTQVRRDDALLNEKLYGTAAIRILIEGKEEKALQRPDVLRAIDDLEAEMRKYPELGSVVSIADHIKRMNRAMHDGDPAEYRIPEDPALVAQYLFLYSLSAGPDGLGAFVDAEYRNAVVRGLSRDDTASFSRALLASLQGFAKRRFAGLPAEARIAGGTIGAQTAMNDIVVREKILNMVQIATIIFVLAGAVLRSLVGGGLVLVPLVVAVAVTLGTMGWTRTWLDMTTAAITAMGVSIGADFAIYLIFRIREEWKNYPPEEAVRRSLSTSGKAVFFVSSAVAAGYLLLPFSGFSIWTRLGVLTALIVSVSALAAITVLPSLVLLGRPKFLGSAREEEEVARLLAVAARN